MKHCCHAKGCFKEVPRKMFMCLKHWRMVPRPVQRLIWKYYNKGQEEGKAEVTRAYLDITDQAIKIVWSAESSSALPHKPY